MPVLIRPKSMAGAGAASRALVRQTMVLCLALTVDRTAFGGSEASGCGVKPGRG